VLVAAVTAVAKVVTPTVVPTVVPTALMHQNTAIAIAATACASSLRGVKRLFIIRTPFLSLPTSAFPSGSMRDLRVDSAAAKNQSGGVIPCALSHASGLGKDQGDLCLGIRSLEAQSPNGTD
jgi:hypothetical protein